VAVVSYTTDGEHREPVRGEFPLPVHLFSRKIAAQLCAALKATALEVFQPIPTDVWRRTWVSSYNHYGQGNDAILNYQSQHIFRMVIS
jgi:hypothetical protein